MTDTLADMAAHTATSYEVWTVTPDGVSAYRYRDDLIWSVAARWADAWNAAHPIDVPDGYTFIAVRRTVTFEEVER